MQTHEYRFPKCGRGEAFELVGLGDIHHGSASCDKKKLKRMVEWISGRPRCYWVGLGDYCENITHRDMRRFDPRNVDRSYAVADLADFLVKTTDDVSRILAPIKGRCIGLATGNHEVTAARDYDYNATQRLCDNLGVKNLGWTCLTRLVFSRNNGSSLTLVLMTEHSNVAGRKKGSKVNRLEDRAADFEFDILLWGHSHDKVASKKTRLYLTRLGDPTIKTHEMVFGIVPSFLHTYEIGTTGYGERAGYSPTSLGILLITILPFVQRRSEGKTIETYSIHISQ